MIEPGSPIKLIGGRRDGCIVGCPPYKYVGDILFVEAEGTIHAYKDIRLAEGRTVLRYLLNRKGKAKFKE